LAIFVLVLWIAVAVAGATLLRAGGAARRRAQQTTAAEVPVRIGAVPLTPDGRPPPGPRVRVTSPPGEHPLLEFSHPALGSAGIACWIMFVLVGYRPFAWIALAILLVTMALGLGWLATSRTSAWRFPPRLVAVHGIAVALSITLTVLTAITASR
jgi:hypothetical protein